ncbi:hypothetical protein AB0F18_33965 [Streptomyces sp. NPDC029216]|uniref:hypothetical protein n=1 Tax=Streptomyces TaxID=1883 RepID=UPI0033D8ED8C
MRTLIALPVFYVVSRAPQIAAFLVGSGLVVLFTQTGMPIASGLTVLAIALLGALAVGLACTLPVLTMANGRRRAVRDACWEAAEDVADWARWDTSPPNP